MLDENAVKKALASHKELMPPSASPEQVFTLSKSGKGVLKQDDTLLLHTCKGVIPMTGVQLLRLAIGIQESLNHMVNNQAIEYVEVSTAQVEGKPNAVSIKAMSSIGPVGPGSKTPKDVDKVLAEVSALAGELGLPSETVDAITAEALKDVCEDGCKCSEKDLSAKYMRNLARLVSGDGNKLELGLPFEQLLMMLASFATDSATHDHKPHSLQTPYPKLLASLISVTCGVVEQKAVEKDMNELLEYLESGGL